MMEEITEGQSVKDFETTLVFGSAKHVVRFRRDATVGRLRETLAELFNVSKENQTRIVFKGTCFYFQ